MATTNHTPSLQTKQSLITKHVYFIINPSTQLIKIGYSIDIVNRMYYLSSITKSKLVFLGCLIGGKDLETEIHKKFWNLHAEGEWFNKGKALMDFIEHETQHEMPKPFSQNTEHKTPDSIYGKVLDTMELQGEDTWEAMINIGVDAEMGMAERRWLLGDLALRIETKYSENSLGVFANALNVNFPTLKQRRTMSKFYPLDTRYQFQSLGYSHFRTAMKLGTIEKSLWALQKADERLWPCWKFEQLLKRLLGKQRRNSDSIDGEIARRYTQSDGFYVVVRVDTEATWQLGQRLTLRAK